MNTGTESGLSKEDLDACDLGALNDHVYEMFFAQNSIIDMDFRFDMIDMVSTPDDDMRAQLRDYAGKIEEFLQYAKDHPDRLENALALLKGEPQAKSIDTAP
jgi:hypothetical protein